MTFPLRNLALLLGMSMTFGVTAAPQPKFVMPSQSQYRAKYAAASVIYKTDIEGERIDYTTFVDMLIDAWLHDHPAQPEAGMQAWEFPTANDWIGCVLSEFPSPDAFKRIEFHSYTRSRDLPEWIQQHESVAGTVDGGRDIVDRLKLLSEWSSLCEDLVRGDDGMRL